MYVTHLGEDLVFTMYSIVNEEGIDLVTYNHTRTLTRFKLRKQRNPTLHTTHLELSHYPIRFFKKCWFLSNNYKNEIQRIASMKFPPDGGTACPTPK